MSKEAMKLALDALQWFTAAEPWDEPDVSKAIKALEAALAKQEQGEPVAWMSEENECIFFDADKPNPMDYDFWTPLYTTPQQRTWVGLTDEETAELVHRYAFYNLAREIEAKLREKNSGP